ncbi:transcription initiation factor TFIID subunit A-domain-containing protein [Phyllosticta capitalensis]|uniref:Transcription initiation factor TFIID subunit A-domain-containing protein n=1 Tax=Phyllosticta capitalensis TaxID=121624 RepID=A0ABR1YEK0_9PEZI
MSGNVPQQGPSGQPGQPGQPQPRALPPGIRVNQVAGLPHLDDTQKAHYTKGLTNLYNTFNRADKDSTEYKTAATKLLEFTKRMGKEVAEWKAKNGQGVAAQQPGARPSSQGGQSQAQPPQQPNMQSQQQQQPPQQQQQQQQQPTPQQTQAHPGPQPNQQGQRPQIPPQILQHVQKFPFALPPGMSQGTPEAETKMKELKQSYLQMLTRQEQVSASVRKMQQHADNTNRQELPANFEAQRNQLQATWQSLERNVQEFRNQQNNWRNMAQQQQGSPQQQASQGIQPNQGAQNQPNQQAQARQTPQQQQPPAPQQTPVPQVKTEGIAPPPNQQQHVPQPHPQAQQTQAPGQANQAQQQMQPQTQQHQAMQGPGPQMANNPAIEATRQQMNANRTSMSPATSGPQQPGQTQPTFAQGGNMTPGSQVPGQMPQQQQQQQQQNMNPQRPPLNPQQAAQMNQMHQGSPHPQSAGNHPMPLTHGQAMGVAARTHSEARVTPQIQQQQQQQQQNQGYPLGNRTGSEQMTNPKMPIPKNLPPQPPHPVNMGPARPTMGGPSNGAPGMLGQPVVSAHPQYHLEGDESRVLSKKKLDELVRQVTGAGELPAGETLAPEAMLQLADDFLDNVVASACKLAKLRESSQLEIRDIQCVLERNYNIRIPGYASDEIRTVRKFQPAPGWTQKMNAVQAAKVMGGKTD